MNPAGKLKFVFLIAFIYILATNSCFGQVVSNEISTFNIYQINPRLLEDYSVIEKGSEINTVLLDNLESKKKDIKDINFTLNDTDNFNLAAIGKLIMSNEARRFSKHSNLQLSLNMLTLPDGQEVLISALSPSFKGIHPPHANTSSINIIRTITNLSLAGGPITLGANLGASFLVSGLLSAYQNGIKDFLWGGLDGAGLSFIERILRKQPDLFLEQGTIIPFTLKEDLKINKGIQKEKIEKLNISKEEARNKIEQLLKWGDLAGALEFSVKTQQQETYNKLMKKVTP